MSPKYTRANCYLTVVWIISIARWYVSCSFFSPNDIRVSSYVPKCIVNAVLSRYLGAIRILQYPEFASRILKTFAYPRLSIHSYILEIGYASRLVIALMRW